MLNESSTGDTDLSSASTEGNTSRVTGSFSIRGADGEALPVKAILKTPGTFFVITVPRPKELPAS